jgi:hypothetical protein
MLIGRTDDPQNPCRVAAFEVTDPFGCGSRNPSGPAVIVPRQIGRTHDRFSHQIRFFSQTPLHSKGRPHTPYAPALDPAIHPLRKTLMKFDGYAGQARV